MICYKRLRVGRFLERFGFQAKMSMWFTVIRQIKLNFNKNVKYYQYKESYATVNIIENESH